MELFLLKTCKGQAVLLDFILAFFVFILVWVFLMSQFDSKITETEKINDLQIMKLKSTQVLENLVKSKGYPNNWETLTISDLNSVGLAITDRSLSEEKLSAFSNFSIDYYELKAKMSLEEYDFYFVFTGVDSVTAGIDSVDNANEIILHRIVNYKGEVGDVMLKVYKLE